jgi:hypothetical protein
VWKERFIRAWYEWRELKWNEPMETIDKTQLIRKKKLLEEISAELRKQFIGLDTIIDEVMALIMPWYLFPAAQSRPTVINLWGLTGSGKTTLVRSIVEQLDYKRMYTHLDMGEFESDSAEWIKNMLTDDLEFLHGKPALICLDEFQFARTIDGNNQELGKDKLRVIWELIDSGRLEYVPGRGTYYLLRADNCLKRIDRLIKAGVSLHNGEVICDTGAFLNIFEGFYFDDVHRYGKAIDKGYFLSRDFAEGLFNLFDNDVYSTEAILKQISDCDLQGLRMFLIEGMATRPATRTLDLSQSLIFVLGNLDEAYHMSGDLNPDISADDFHERTSRITIADIKRALRRRFRAEQIARLGNNHILYRSFTTAQFRLLIRQELAKIAAFVWSQVGWKVTFDEAVTDLVYAEGVFPAQGTRPVFTTIKNLVESRVSKLMVTLLEYQLEVSHIVWSCGGDSFLYQVYSYDGALISSITDKVALKLENLRRSVDPEIQAHTAVHEAGHAILAALTLRIVPSVVVSRTAGDAEGFCLVNFPKGPLTRETLRKDIVITLGGYVAEKLIFGEEHTSSGVYADIEEASILANKAIRNYAMGSDPIHLAVQSVHNENRFFDLSRYSEQAVRLIRECEGEANRILTKNRLLLLKMAEHLTVHSRMEEPEIEAFVRNYSVEAWPAGEGFIKKEQYFKFHTVLLEQLRGLNEEQGDSLIGRVVIEEQISV